MLRWSDADDEHDGKGNQNEKCRPQRKIAVRELQRQLRELRDIDRHARTEGELRDAADGWNLRPAVAASTAGGEVADDGDEVEKVERVPAAIAVGAPAHPGLPSFAPHDVAEISAPDAGTEEEAEETRKKRVDEIFRAHSSPFPALLHISCHAFTY